MNNTITPTLQSEIRTYTLIEQALSAHDDERKLLAQNLADAETRVITAFTDAEVSDITIDGRRWKVECKTFVSPAAGMADDLVSWISSHGGEDLIRPAMHHARRDAFIRELVTMDDGEIVIPDELQGLVQVFEQVKLAKRKV